MNPLATLGDPPGLGTGYLIGPSAPVLRGENPSQRESAKRNILDLNIAPRYSSFHAAYPPRRLYTRSKPASLSMVQALALRPPTAQ